MFAISREPSFGAAFCCYHLSMFKTPPDPAWLPFVKLGMGMMLLIILASLSALIGLGKVEQQTSHGLDIILGAIAVLTGQFSQWAFGGSKSDDAKASLVPPPQV